MFGVLPQENFRYWATSVSSGDAPCVTAISLDDVPCEVWSLTWDKPSMLPQFAERDVPIEELTMSII